MQALLKIGLVMGIFISINVFYLLQTDTNELEGIPVLKDIVASVHKLRDVLVTEEKDESHASKQSDHHSQETRSSVNKESANEELKHAQHERVLKDPEQEDTTVKQATKTDREKSIEKEVRNEKDEVQTQKQGREPEKTDKNEKQDTKEPATEQKKNEQKEIKEDQMNTKREVKENTKGTKEEVEQNKKSPEQRVKQDEKRTEQNVKEEKRKTDQEVKESSKKDEEDAKENKKITTKEIKENTKIATQEKNKQGDKEVPSSGDNKRKNVVNLAVVACLDRVKETLIMLKSALLQTRAPLHFHILADDANQAKFENELITWEQFKNGAATYTIHGIQFPGKNTEKWRTLFRPCASQRLFLPTILDKTDALLYVDTDVLFMRPLDDMWAFFKEFNSTQLAGVAPEHEPSGSGAGWYNRFARHPYYGQLGVNSGVMLMNLTRMREVNWIDKMMAYYNEYHLRITWGDQDLVNIFFHFYPEKLYVFPCEWNFRPDHCMYRMCCDSAKENGVSILHGNREVFHNEKQPTFKAVYDAFLQHKSGDGLATLIGRVEENLKNESIAVTSCGQVQHVFVKQLKTQSMLQDTKTQSKKEPGVQEKSDPQIQSNLKGELKEEDVVSRETSDPQKQTVEDTPKAAEKQTEKKKRPRIHLAVVACLNRVEETLVMLKSALLQTKAKLKFHVFADDENQPKFKSEFSHWPAFRDGKASFKVYPIELPKENQQKWRTLWRPCASQRLFLPNVLPKQDALLYVDTDVLFLRPLDDIWKFFSSFNSTQIAAVSPEHEEGYRGGWYNRFARHPYYGTMGVNSGVMLMNLTRMREVDWVNKMIDYYEIYKYNITWGDQCLINIFFHFYPEGLLVYPCEWNTRPDHCMYGIHCQTSNSNGASIIHGNREVFHNEKQPAFKALYEGFRDHPFDGPLEDLLQAVKANLSNGTILSMPCGRVSHIFTKQLERQVKRKNKAKKL